MNNYAHEILINIIKISIYKNFYGIEMIFYKGNFIQDFNN
jgi:hypothetical protein